MADPRLLIPATRELLDGWVGPLLTSENGWPIAFDGHISAVRANGAPAPGPEVSGLCLDTGAYRTAPLAEARLDLGRDEAANRAAVCLARTLGHTPANGVTWVCEYYHRSLGGHLFPHRGSRDHRDLGMTPPSRPSHFGHRARAVGWYLQVPELASLDAKDDTRLPGGARLVDRLALAIVTRHVLGGPRG